MDESTHLFVLIEDALFCSNKESISNELVSFVLATVNLNKMYLLEDAAYSNEFHTVSFKKHIVKISHKENKIFDNLIVVFVCNESFNYNELKQIALNIHGAQTKEQIMQLVNQQ